MKQSRLENLADGIFAIVMTLLVLELKVPVLTTNATLKDLPDLLRESLPALLAYILSFAILFTYWRAHNYIVSGFAKGIDIWLTNINAVFLFFVGLVPFTSYVLGRYSESQAAIVLYGVNIIAIGLALFWMRYYVLTAPGIPNAKLTKGANQRANIRILTPVALALLAIILSVWDTRVSFVLFTAAIAFNIFPISMEIIHYVVDKFFPRA